jgi:hypothetical protein
MSFHVTLQMLSHPDAGQRGTSENKLQLTTGSVISVEGTSGRGFCPVQALCISHDNHWIMHVIPGMCVKGQIGGRDRWQSAVEEGEGRGTLCFPFPP